MTFVVDCSVALSWCFVDERSAYNTALFDTMLDRSAHAPHFLKVELANGLVSGMRRGRLTMEQAEEFTARITAAPIVYDELGANHAWRDVVPLALSCRLSAYDALYLELALRLKLPLATFDARLMAAATTLNIEVMSFA